MASVTRNLDLRLLRTFIAVAETGRMTRAAQVVNLTQSAVSQQVMRLENSLQLTLFDRRADAARLTREGERLLARAQRLVAANDEIVNEMRRAEFSGEVRLGVPHDLVAALMPSILRTFSQNNPDVLVTLVSNATSVLRKMLHEGQLHLAVMTEQEQGGHGQHLMTDRLVWVGAKDGDAAKRRPLSVALGRETCAFRACAVNALDRAGIEWRAICQVGSLEPVFATLEADMAVAPFLTRTVPERLAVLKQAELPPLPSFHINLRTPRSGETPASQELARHILEGFERRWG